MILAKEKKNYYYNPDLMYKFGYTHMTNPAMRFSEETARLNKFRAIPIGRDYDVVVKWSGYFEFEQALELERWFGKEMFPFKNLSTRETYNGITECRCMDEAVVDSFVRLLHEKYPKSEHPYQPGFYNCYFVEFHKKK